MCLASGSGGGSIGCGGGGGELKGAAAGDAEEPTSSSSGEQRGGPIPTFAQAPSSRRRGRTGARSGEDTHNEVDDSDGHARPASKRRNAGTAAVAGAAPTLPSSTQPGQDPFEPPAAPRDERREEDGGFFSSEVCQPRSQPPQAVRVFGALSGGELAAVLADGLASVGQLKVRIAAVLGALPRELRLLSFPIVASTPTLEAATPPLMPLPIGAGSPLRDEAPLPEGLESVALVRLDPKEAAEAELRLRLRGIARPVRPRRTAASGAGLAAALPHA